jgi:hypothetical protein
MNTWCAWARTLSDVITFEFLEVILMCEQRRGMCHVYTTCTIHVFASDVMRESNKFKSPTGLCVARARC